MARSRKVVMAGAAILVLIAANVLLAEVLAGLYFRFSNGSFIWARAATAASDKPAAAPVADDPVKTKMVLSPYFGDNTLPGVRFRGLWTDEFYKERITGQDYLPSYYDKLSVNNHGFWSFHDYPFEPKSNEFVVGVFGGSVAFHFWLSTLDERSPILKKFAAATNKRVVFLNFASGGRKQPQSMLELAYFMSIGQKFDFVLNLDGFNEVYDSWINFTNYKVDYSMPFAEFAFKIQNAFLERAFFGGDSRIAYLIKNRDGWAARAATTRSALVFYTAEVLSRYYRNQITALETQLSAGRKDLRYPVHFVPSRAENFDQVIPKLAELWFNSSVAMNRMAAPAGIPYLHVLQPNQYFSRKQLTAKEEEWTVRGPTHIPFQTIIPQAYKAFLDRVPQFAGQKIAFVDATPIYDGVADTVFIDWCCHVNERGNHILNGLIEPKMIEMIGRAGQAPVPPQE